MTQRALGHFRPGHSGQPLNYVDTHKAYDGAYDVPQKAKHAKLQVLHFLDPDTLGTKKVPWNNMTTPSGPFADHRGPLNQGTMPFAPRFPDPSRKRALHVGTSIKVEIDKRAERIPKRDPVVSTTKTKLQFDPRKLLGDKVPSNLGGTGAPQLRTDSTIPPGKAGRPQTRFIVHVDCTGKLDMLEPWNPSTQPDKSVLQTNQNQTLEHALANTKAREMKLTQRRGGVVDNYKKTRDTQRETKKIEALREGDFDDYLAAVRAQQTKNEGSEVDEMKRKELDRVELVYSKDWKQKEYYCDGQWAFDEGEGRHRWSCCGSYQQDPPGCQPKKKGAKCWNFASIN
uniref:Uncharacterized protein n=1 Tax=Hemiselmis andersenii TaxID=464988 RepID=A0A7S0Y6H2_HEMAN|mmetsp:Transcript_8836/g.20583  ORF Transcript_8836/g.20583 Transcript_8836/m.20583 type:complete len:341 (+) Transcript_8836:61-1083(+)